MGNMYVLHSYVSKKDLLLSPEPFFNDVTDTVPFS